MSTLEPESDAAAEPRTVLVADDSPMNFELLSEVLTGVGWSVAWAADGGQALRMLREKPYELLLLDIHMPVMGGIEVISQLRSDPAAYVPKVVIITGDAFLALSGDAMALRPYGILTKPISIGSVIQVLESLHPTGGPLKDRRQ